MPNNPANPKVVLTIILVSLAVSPLIYIALTYVTPITVARPMPSAMQTALFAVAVLTTLLGPVMERFLLDRAKYPQEVQTAVIVAGALAEASAVLGLVVYFMSGRREWIFFVLSLLAFGRLFLRLPEFHRLMDEKAG